MQFPECYLQQKEIASKFKEISAAKFDNCAGCMDGLLIWITKTNSNEESVPSVGPKKFYCGRKCNFGLNMQGTCDVKCRTLDVSIGHPGSISDYLAFVTSNLHAKLERKGFLAPGLVVYGDNAYVSNECMVTPCKN